MRTDLSRSHNDLGVVMAAEAIGMINAAICRRQSGYRCHATGAEGVPGVER